MCRVITHKLRNPTPPKSLRNTLALTFSPGEEPLLHYAAAEQQQQQQKQQQCLSWRTKRERKFKGARRKECGRKGGMDEMPDG